MDKSKAVTATAHKLARLIYAMLTKGQDRFEERHRERVVRSLKQRAWQMGMVMMAAEQSVRSVMKIKGLEGASRETSQGIDAPTSGAQACT